MSLLLPWPLSNFSIISSEVNPWLILLFLSLLHTVVIVFSFMESPSLFHIFSIGSGVSFHYLAVSLILLLSFGTLSSPVRSLNFTLFVMATKLWSESTSVYKKDIATKIRSLAPCFKYNVIKLVSCKVSWFSPCIPSPLLMFEPDVSYSFT